MNLPKELTSGKAILLVLTQDNYFKKLSDIIKRLKNKKICYVSTNKGVDVITKTFQQKKIPVQNTHVIDCITSSILSKTKKGEHCTFVSSPNALTEMSLALKISPKYNFVILDSLSTLMFYHKKDTLLKFSNNLINRIKLNKNTTLVLVMFKKDKENSLFKDLIALVDKVIYYN